MKFNEGALNLKKCLGYAEYECTFKLKPLHSTFQIFSGEITIGDFKLTYNEPEKILQGRIRIKLKTVDDAKALKVAKEKIKKELLPFLPIATRTPWYFNPNEVIIVKHPEQKSGPKIVGEAELTIQVVGPPRVEIIPPNEFKEKVIDYMDKYALLKSKDKEILELAINFLNRGASSENLIERTLCDFISLELLVSKLIQRKYSSKCCKKDSWVKELEKRYNVNLSYEGHRINQIRAALVHGKAKITRRKTLNAEEAIKIVEKHIDELEQTIIRLIEIFLEDSIAQ